ncbi:MAG TPA: hypothetical protein VF286_05455 [Acidiphilium sp.]
MTNFSEFFRPVRSRIGAILRETSHDSLLYWAKVGEFDTVHGELRSIFSSRAE